MQICFSAELVIEIPGNLGQEDSSYRLDYYPPFGNPAPNTTIASKEIGDEIQFSNVLAGTKYNFWLYYTNSTHHNLLAWTVSITTGNSIFAFFFIILLFVSFSPSNLFFFSSEFTMLQFMLNSNGKKIWKWNHHVWVNYMKIAFCLASIFLFFSPSSAAVAVATATKKIDSFQLKIKNLRKKRLFFLLLQTMES